MLSAATTIRLHSHLRPRDTVDSMWAMGTEPHSIIPLSTAFQSSHSLPGSRGLFCAQLLTRVLHPLAEAAIARHLPAHLVDAVNHGGVISAAKGLSDLDQLHFQELTG